MIIGNHLYIYTNNEDGFPKQNIHPSLGFELFKDCEKDENGIPLLPKNYFEILKSMGLRDATKKRENIKE